MTPEIVTLSENAAGSATVNPSRVVAPSTSKSNNALVVPSEVIWNLLALLVSSEIVNAPPFPNIAKSGLLFVSVSAVSYTHLTLPTTRYV